MKPYKVIILLNLDLYIDIFKIYCLIKCYMPKYMAVSWKGTCETIWAMSWTRLFFHEIPFSLTRTIERQTMVMWTWASGRHVLENEWRTLAISKETINNIYHQQPILSFRAKISILENLYQPLEAWKIPTM